eukprot:Amastigsp_a514276_35.p2 type:complete len:110 gc:universal Amastigsp_a514276_35:903-574(-)
MVSRSEETSGRLSSAARTSRAPHATPTRCSHCLGWAPSRSCCWATPKAQPQSPLLGARLLGVCSSPARTPRLCSIWAPPSRGRQRPFISAPASRKSTRITNAGRRRASR